MLLRNCLRKTPSSLLRRPAVRAFSSADSSAAPAEASSPSAPGDSDPAASSKPATPLVDNVRTAYSITKDENVIPIPVISLSEENASAVLADALHRFGCCYLQQEGATAALQNKVMDATKSLFALPLAKKNSICVQNKTTGFTRGYIGVGQEGGHHKRLEVKESFSFGSDWPKKFATFENPLQGHNVWPEKEDWAVENRQLFANFFNQMVGVSQQVASKLSYELYDKNSGFLSKFLSKGDTISISRLFHYFPYSRLDEFNGNVASLHERVGSSPHTDWGFVTLVLQNEAGGLQMFHKGKWMDVPPLENTVLVTAGDYLSILTNGRCISPLHRVVCDGKFRAHERYSVVFFYYPDFDAVIPSVDDATRNVMNRHKKKTDQDFTHLLDQAVQEPKSCFGEYLQARWTEVHRTGAF